MADPFFPIPEVRKMTVKDLQFVDAYGDTWQDIDGIETKVGYRNPVKVLKEHDTVRIRIRADLNAAGLRETVTVDGPDGPVQMLPPELAGKAFQFGMTPTSENIAKVTLGSSLYTEITKPVPTLWQQVKNLFRKGR